MIRSLLFTILMTFIVVKSASSQNELSTYITNGTTTSITTYSDFVSLFYDRTAYDNIYGTHSLCGGTMLGSQYVLTAAHCIFDGSGNPDIEFMLFMAVGQVDNESDWIYATPTIRASEFYYDSSFSDSETNLWENDIAIIKLTSPLNISSPVVRPISQNDYRDATHIFVTIGHGNIASNTSTNLLYEAPLTYVDNTRCESSGLSGLHDSQICFTSPSNSSSSDLDLINGVCSGDSGGPVYWDNGGILTQVGITSFGPTNCGIGLGDERITGVFTEIADYDSWITSVLTGLITPQYIATDEKRIDYYNTLIDAPTDPTPDNTSIDEPVVATASSSGGGAAGGLLLLAMGCLLKRRRSDASMMHAPINTHRG